MIVEDKWNFKMTEVPLVGSFLLAMYEGIVFKYRIKHVIWDEDTEPSHREYMMLNARAWMEAPPPPRFGDEL